MLDVKIKGLAELEKALQQLPDKLERNILRGALRQGALVIAAKAKELAPVRTGKLRNSIRVSSRIKKGIPVVVVKAGGRKKGEPFYAHMVEFGTAGHEIRPAGAKSLFIAGLMREIVHHPGAQKTPFMRPAFDASVAAATLAFAEHLKKRLTKAGIETPEVGLVLDEE